MYHPAVGFWRATKKRRLLWAALGTLERIERQIPDERIVRRYQVSIQRIIASVITLERAQQWYRRLSKQEEDEEILEDLADRAVSAIITALIDKITDLRVAALARTEQHIGFGLPRELKDKAVSEAFELVRNIPDTLRDELRLLMRETMAEARTQFDFARTIRRRWREFSKYRAELIARTEWARVAGRATLELYKQQGTQAKVWYNVGDARVCEKCRENAAVGPIPITESFPSGDDTVPAHPGCRCNIAAATLR